MITRSIKLMRIINWLFFIILILFFSACSQEKPSLPINLRDSKDFPKTDITSHLEEKINKGKNLIYCSTFQLAWNELKGVIGGNITTTDEPEYVKYLNKGLSTKNDISEKCYVAHADFIKNGIVEKINKELKEKFKIGPPDFSYDLQPNYILAYAYLQKELVFKNEFAQVEDGLLFTSGENKTKVKAFGIYQYQGDTYAKKLHKQVQVLFYDYNQKEFVIELKSTSPYDEIILAMIKPKDTLLETIQKAEALIKKGRENPEFLAGPFGVNDELKIPEINFDIHHKYSELYNKFLTNNGFGDYFFLKADQDVRFILNKKGAELRSKAEIPLAHIPRISIFDKPFLLYIKEKDGKYPYLAMWIDNAELLQKF